MVKLIICELDGCNYLRINEDSLLEIRKYNPRNFNCLNLETGELCDCNFDGMEERIIEIDFKNEIKSIPSSFWSLLPGSFFVKEGRNNLFVKIVEFNKKCALCFGKDFKVDLGYSLEWQAAFRIIEYQEIKIEI